MVQGMDNNDVEPVLLPRRLRAAEVPAAFREIQARRELGPVTVDFQAVEDFDSSALALLSYLQGCAADIQVVNLGEGLRRSFQVFLKGKPPVACEVPEIGLTTRV